MRRTSSHTRIKLFLSILAVVLVSLACLSSEPEAPAEEPAEPAAAEDSPVPAATDTPEPSPTPDLAATESAQATEAAAETVSKVEETLKSYQIDLPTGHLAWQQDSEISMAVFEYGAETYEKIADEEVIDDFILYTKVTWTSTSGLAGCGVIFRGEGDFDFGAQYRFYLMRLSGYPAWDIELYDEGRFVKNLTGSVQRGKSIDLAQGATNEYIIVADGATLTIYANGSRMGGASTEITSNQLSEGQIAFLTWHESGETECAYNDSWLWVIE